MFAKYKQNNTILLHSNVQTNHVNKFTLTFLCTLNISIYILSNTGPR